MQARKYWDIEDTSNVKLKWQVIYKKLWCAICNLVLPISPIIVLYQFSFIVSGDNWARWHIILRIIFLHLCLCCQLISILNLYSNKYLLIRLCIYFILYNYGVVLVLLWNHWLRLRFSIMIIVTRLTFIYLLLSSCLARRQVVYSSKGAQVTQELKKFSKKGETSTLTIITNASWWLL